MIDFLFYMLEVNFEMLLYQAIYLNNLKVVNVFVKSNF